MVCMSIGCSRATGSELHSAETAGCFPGDGVTLIVNSVSLASAQLNVTPALLASAENAPSCSVITQSAI